MELGKQIIYYRKRKNLTQEMLAEKLSISNQAISKWENNQCYPDISLLPKLAEIFEISLDELFGLSKQTLSPSLETISNLPWEDDGELRAVIYIGTNLVQNHQLSHTQKKICEEINFVYEGDALNITSNFSVTCNSVAGNVTAGNSVYSDSVRGNITAGNSITCSSVYQNVTAGNSVSIDCGSIRGNVTAGNSVDCGDVFGNIKSGHSVNCSNVEGSIHVGKSVTCGNVSQNVIIEGGTVQCTSIKGDVHAKKVIYLPK